LELGKTYECGIRQPDDKQFLLYQSGNPTESQPHDWLFMYCLEMQNDAKHMFQCLTGEVKFRKS